MSISLFLLLGCEKELYEDSIKNNERSITIKETTLKELLKNPIFNTAYSKVKSKTLELKNTNARTALEDQYNFTITDDDVLVMETNDSIKSYTFLIERETVTTDYFENLVIQIDSSGDIDALIMKYTPSSPDLTNFEGTKEVTPLVQSGRVYYFSNGCVMTTWTTCSYLVNNSNHPEWASVHIAGAGCNNPNYFNYYSSIVCPNENGGGGGDPTPTPTDDDPTIDGGSGGSVITNPNTGMTEAEKKVKAFKMQLSSSQSNCFNSLPLNVQAELQGFVAYTLLALEEGTTVTSENPVHTEAEAMMAEICSNPGVYSSIIPFIIEKQIDDSELDPCSKEILDNLKVLQNKDIKNILSRLNNPITAYNTKIKTEQFQGFDLGQTTHPTNNNFIIKIRTNYVDGTDHEPNSTPTTLSIASTIIHEIIHAHLHSLYDDYNNGLSSEFCNFPLLFEAYVSHTYPGGNPVDAHHEEMLDKFVNIIASALQEFHTGLPVSDFESLDQVYTDLALSTFSGTPIFNHKYPATGTASVVAVRTRILNRRFAEARNQPIGDQNPIGSPCN